MDLDSELLVRCGGETQTYSVSFFRSDALPPFSSEEKPLLLHGYRTVNGRLRELWFAVAVGAAAKVDEVFDDAPMDQIVPGRICVEDSMCAISGPSLYVFGGRNTERRDDGRRWVRSLNTKNPGDGWMTRSNLCFSRSKHMLGYAGDFVFLLPGRYNVLHSNCLMVYNTAENSCRAIDPPPPCLDCNCGSVIDKSFNPKFCGNFGDKVGVLVCNSVGDHLYRFHPEESGSWMKICDTTFPTILSPYHLREYCSLNGLLYLSYFCGKSLKTRIRVYYINPMQFGDRARLLLDILLPKFPKFPKRKSAGFFPKRFLVALSDYCVCYFWKDPTTFRYMLARVDLTPSASHQTIDVMQVDVEDTIQIVHCIRFDSFEKKAAVDAKDHLEAVQLKCDTTKGMKSDNGVAKEIKLNSDQSMSEKKLESNTLLTEEKLKSNNSRTGEKFSEGTRVEVGSDKDGFKGSWFAATIIEALGRDNYLIKYERLRTEDDKEFLQEEADALQIRPYPPETAVDRYKLHDEVDALYNDGWLVGVICKVLPKSRYMVYLQTTSEELVFDHSQLRLHQDWIDGKWVVSSQALKT